ncbi:MAG: tetratricopeptide (TPR) repeat protein [Cognaticolwellia sp.]|jgi:tetratricopeptide (TPR) repeat protein
MSQLGPFLLQERLADGGMAQLWRAQATHSGTPVAIKVLSETTTERERTALAREVRAVAALNHPNIVRVLDSGQVPSGHPLLPGGAPYLAMELARGGSLAQRVGQIPWPRLQGMLADILAGLAHAHARGVVHLDIKPGNVLLSQTAQAILADFGLAHALGSAVGRHAIEGTPAYMAPEQLMGNWRAYGPWTDLYAVGALAWELCTSKPPFLASDPALLRQAHLNQDPPNFRAILDVPTDLEPWLRRMLIKSPAERFTYAADALDALLRLGPHQQPQVWAAANETWAPGMPALSHVGPAKRTPAPFPAGPMTSHEPTLVRGLGLGLFAHRRVPMVGREDQQTLLWDGLRRVHLHRKIHGVLVEGTAGVGKSHLTRWIEEQAHASGSAVVLRASHNPIGAANEGIPGALARHFSVVGLKEPEHQIAQALAAIGSNPYESKALAQWIQPEQARQLPLKTRVGILARLLGLQDRPILLVLEDIQWSEEAVPIVLGLLERLEDLPVFLVMTLRREELSPLLEAQLDRLLHSPRFRAQEIAPMSADQTEDLIDGMLLLDPALRQDLARRCKGNPLMAVQALGSLVEQQALVLGPGGFALRDPSQNSIPDDLPSLWEQRLPVLGKQERLALELAATLGHQVSDAEWEAVSPPQVRLSALKDALLERELARPWPGGWQFVHSLLPETLLKEAQQAGRAADHHRRCAAYLGAQSEDLRRAKHLLAAGDLSLAAQTLAMASAQARFGTDPSRSLAILTLLEETLTGLPEESLQSERIQCAMSRAALRRHLGEFEEAVQLLNTAQTQARALPSPSLVANALSRKGECYRQQGQIKAAQRAFEQARALCEAEDLKELEMEALFGLSDVARQQRNWALAVALLERAAAMWVNLPDSMHGRSSRDRSSILRSLSAVHRARGDLEQAQQVLSQALDLARETGLGISLANALNDMGEQARLSGRLADARMLYEEAAEMTDAMGSYGGVYPRLNLGLLGISLGDLGLARQSCEVALRDSERFALPQLIPGILVCLAWCSAKQQDWPMVEERLSLAAAGFSQHGDLDPDNAWPALHCGTLCAAAGQTTLARAAAELAQRQYAGLDDATGLARAEKLLAAL